jgi:hypothetical protein
MNAPSPIRSALYWLLGALLSSCELPVRVHASGDLNCPNDQIQVEGGPIDYVARGCGRSQAYRCATNNRNRYCWKH